jgi:retinoblastoma-like protein 2
LCFVLISTEIANKHFRFAEMLYYKVLESVIEQEQKRLGDMDLSVSTIIM